MEYTIYANKKKSKIHKHIYGHFAEHLGHCIYDGLFVGEDSNIENIGGIRTDVITALRELHIPVLRWPGGCFADEYHWRHGVGPMEQRQPMINTHWGGVTESNHFGTHEFLRLCELLGCDPYISGNVGSGTVQEMRQWMEYMTSKGESAMSLLRKQHGKEEPWKIPFFGIGNESWGCGGNMRPEYYADLLRQYGTYVRNYDGNQVYKIACGANADDYHWTEALMKQAKHHMHGLSLHYYTLPEDSWEDKGSATNFDEALYYKTLSKTLYMKELLDKHIAIMDRYDPEGRIGLIIDEWGAWYNVEPGTKPGFLYQQNTMRDALIAGINLNLFNRYSHRITMANIAQMVNVLQSMILTSDDQMVRTPTYYVFELYKEHQDSTLLESSIDVPMVGSKDHQVPAIIESVSLTKQGDIIITLCHLDNTKSRTIDMSIKGVNIQSIAGEYISGHINDYNDFTSPDVITKKAYTNYVQEHGTIKLILDPCSITKLIVQTNNLSSDK